MGSIIELNDTLQITKEQGFPAELELERHLRTPYTIENFKDTVFEFKNKKNARIYHAPPVRNFLVENRGGKWIYWGLIHILEQTIDLEHQVTSGKFKIVKIYTPEEMKQAFALTDGGDKTNFFS